MGREAAVVDDGQIHIAWLGTRPEERIGLFVSTVDLTTGELLGTAELPGSKADRLIVNAGGRNGQVTFAWLERAGRRAPFELGIVSAAVDQLATAEINLFDYGRVYLPPRVRETGLGVFVLGVSRSVDEKDKTLRVFRKAGQDWAPVEALRAFEADAYHPVLVGQDFLSLYFLSERQILLTRSENGREWSAPQIVSRGRVDGFVVLDDSPAAIAWVEESMGKVRLWYCHQDPKGAWSQPAELGEIQGNALRFLAATTGQILVQYQDRKTSCAVVEAIDVDSEGGRRRLDSGEAMCTRPLTPAAYSWEDLVAITWVSGTEAGDTVFFNSTQGDYASWGEPESLLQAREGQGLSAPHLCHDNSGLWLLHFAYESNRGPFTKQAPRGDILLRKLRGVTPWYSVF
jgi:hypothetical protein